VSRGYLGGFRKRKTERVTIAKKTIVDKEEADRRWVNPATVL